MYLPVFSKSFTTWVTHLGVLMARNGMLWSRTHGACALCIENSTVSFTVCHTCA
jgi:hypothetical protein